MLRIRGKLGCDRLSRGTTRPHTDAATALGVCIYIEFRDLCSVFATLWIYFRIRGKVASLLFQRQG